MTPEEFLAGAETEALGDAWGVPLWRFANPHAAVSVDVHAADEPAARAAALEALPALLGAAGTGKKKPS